MAASRSERHGRVAFGDETPLHCAPDGDRRLSRLAARNVRPEAVPPMVVEEPDLVAREELVGEIDLAEQPLRLRLGDVALLDQVVQGEVILRLALLRHDESVRQVLFEVEDPRLEAPHRLPILDELSEHRAIGEILLFRLLPAEILIEDLAELDLPLSRARRGVVRLDSVHHAIGDPVDARLVPAKLREELLRGRRNGTGQALLDLIPAARHRTEDDQAGQQSRRREDPADEEPGARPRPLSLWTHDL
jgi:hypothetical protein